MYNNECTAECQNVEIVSPHNCLEEKRCFCTNDSHPVCGADGKAYTNSCHLRCAEVESDPSE